MHIIPASPQKITLKDTCKKMSPFSYPLILITSLNLTMKIHIYFDLEILFKTDSTAKSHMPRSHWNTVLVIKKHATISTKCIQIAIKVVTVWANTLIKTGTWKQPRCPTADKWIRKLWYIYTMEYYSAIKKNSFESVLMRWMKLEPIIQSEVSQKGKHQ